MATQRNKILTLSSTGINTYNILNIPIAHGELTVLRSRGHVIVTANQIVSVLAVVGGSLRVVACLEAELVTANETVEGVSISYSMKENVLHTYSS